MPRGRHGGKAPVIRYLVNRLMTMVLTLVAISVLVFAIIQLPPGDYLTSYIAEIQAQGEQVTADKIQFLREEYGLDKPLWEQYLVWVTGLVHGDLGYSFEYSQPVADVVGERMPLTLLLNAATVIFVYLVSFPIGIYSATHQYSWTDHGLSFLGFLGLATPNFLLALILLYFANVWFGTSIGGLMAPEFIDAPWSLAKVGSVLAHLWVPVVVIGTAGTAGMIRRLRANLLDELHRQYVTTARAKGLSERRILFKYPLRMALNPFIADLGSILPQIVSGSVIISAVMSLPTTGPMLLSSLRSQDMYLAGSFLMFLAVLTVVGMFISDLLLAALDPRIRLGLKAAR
nr:ABC transporter permease [Jiella avicenniae]